MRMSTIFIIYILLGAVLAVAAYVQRSGWGAGGEWFLMLAVVPVAGMIPIKERSCKRWRSGYKKGLRN